MACKKMPDACGDPSAHLPARKARLRDTIIGQAQHGVRTPRKHRALSRLQL